MFEKIKHFFGIESVKIKLTLPETQPTPAVIKGKLTFQSLTRQKVNSVTITLVEHYSMGRKKKVHRQRFDLGTITLNKDFYVPPQKAITISFKLPYKLVHSEMDQLANSNILLKGVRQAGKLIGNISSTYEVIAEADVNGMGLPPFDKVIIEL